MPPTRRFLFLYSRTGGGHLAAARAVAAALNEKFGQDAQVELVDIFAESGRWPFQHFPAWYPTMLGWRGWPWRVFYRATDNAQIVRTVSRLLWPYVHKPLHTLLSRHPADVIVSFHPIPNVILASYRDQHLPHTPLAVVVQDFVSAPRAWFAPGYDAYFLPWPETQKLALAQGLPPERLHVSGMPVGKEFGQMMNFSQAEVRGRLGLNENMPVVLFIGGGEGVGDMLPFVQDFMARKPRAQVVVIAGHNARLSEKLRRQGHDSRLKVLGFVQNMPEWMRAADILVTKAGPNTLAEAFIMGLPSIIYHAIPGQEAGNPRLVEENGAGLWAPTPSQASTAIMQLLHNPQKRKIMAGNAHKMARPQAAAHIAQKLWQMADEGNPP